LAWERDRRGLAVAALAAGICLAGLAVSFSITSFAAVLAGLGMVALLRWRWRGAAAAAGLGLAGLAALAIAGGTPSSDIQDYRSIDSGRESLLEGGLDLFEAKPLGGWGSGAFGQAFYEEIERARSIISHSEPVTVAAEQGVVGLAVYAAFVVVALVTLLAGASGSLARAAVAACFVAMLIHSLGYAGFAIDPVTWALLGLGVALRRGPPEASATI
jgi:O-antigen ligase